jgi:hypothetical protein
LLLPIPFFSVTPTPPDAFFTPMPRSGSHPPIYCRRCPAFHIATSAAAAARCPSDASHSLRISPLRRRFAMPIAASFFAADEARRPRRRRHFDQLRCAATEAGVRFSFRHAAGATPPRARALLFFEVTPIPSRLTPNCRHRFSPRRAASSDEFRHVLLRLMPAEASERRRLLPLPMFFDSAADALSIRRRVGAAPAKSVDTGAPLQVPPIESLLPFTEIFGADVPPTISPAIFSMLMLSPRCAVTAVFCRLPDYGNIEIHRFSAARCV